MVAYLLARPRLGPGLSQAGSGRVRHSHRRRHVPGWAGAPEGPEKLQTRRELLGRTKLPQGNHGQAAVAECVRACLKTQAGEGERPREPKYHGEGGEVRARGDARPPKRPFFKQALRGSWPVSVASAPRELPRDSSQSPNHVVALKAP